ncbi:MAG TPA: histidine--tRNA ligase, partial [Chromatiales bacterium]|nr:histidine--tRNA ligase [Chromatiales bacterium]
AVPRLRLLVHCGGGSFKSQFKRADRSGARLALVLGEEEARTGRVSVKPLREAGGQSEVEQSDLADYLAKTLYSGAAE